MLTGEVIKAGRALVFWSQVDLATNSGVSIASIRRIEGTMGIPKTTAATISKIQKAFSRKGVSFEFTDGEIAVKRKTNMVV